VNSRVVSSLTIPSGCTVGLKKYSNTAVFLSH